jgi:PAS domain S-box-containing protein
MAKTSSAEPVPQRVKETPWLDALSAAAAMTRRAGLTESDVLRGVTEALRGLGLVGAVTLLAPDGLLELRNRPLSAALANALRRLTGIDVTGYKFDPRASEAYQHVIDTGEPVYRPKRSEVVGQIMPPGVRRLLPRVMRLLGEMPVILAPVTLAGERLGAFNAAGRWLTPEDVPMVAALADHAAIALGHVRSRAEMQNALERERLRNRVAEAVASNLEIPVVLERVVRLATMVTGADAGAFALLSPDGQSVTFPYMFGLPDSLQVPLPQGRGVAWQIVQSRKVVLIEDYPNSPDAVPEWIQAGIRSVLGVPLTMGDEIIGALGLFSLLRPTAFRYEQAEMVQAMARMAAIAIKNSRSFATASRRAEESQALIRSAAAISASLDLQTVLTEIALQAKSLLRADGSRIHLLDPERGVLRCLVALQPDAEEVMAIELRPGQGLTGHVLERGEPILVADAAADPHGMHVPGTPQDDPEVMALVPLKIRQRSLGVMTVLRFSFDRPFTPSDLELLAAFAAHAAVALENAHLYGQIGQQAQRLEAEVIERTRDLALSEARYRSLVETSLAGIYQLDAAGRYVYANQALATLLERSPEGLIGKPWEEVANLTPESMQLTRERFLAQMRGERSRTDVHEIEFISQGGRRIPALQATSVIYDTEGKPQGATGLVLDISRRKALEAALQAERDQLQVILANIGDAVVVTDSQGRIEYVNPAWERLNGYLAREAVGYTMRLIRSGQTPAEIYPEMWETILAGRIWRGELINRRKDGSLYDAAVTISPIKDAFGTLVSFVGVQHDISALKELDRMKSQFVSDVSHELRTPLTNIRLYLDLLQTTEDAQKTSRYLETMDRESGRLADLIDDLLSLSRLDAGTVSFFPKPTNLNDLLRALVEDRRALAASRGLTLTLECESQLPKAMGDERLLTQVFTNLLTNALNYTPSGGKVALRTSLRKEGDAAWVVAEVEDTGLGIPLEEQPLIFRRFFRGQASRQTKAAGTGLGLAICKEILDRHGGRLEVSSEGAPGRGSRFTAWLPAAES